MILALISSHWPTVLTLGTLICAALIGGWLAQFFRLPRVTAYLLVGLLFAPATYEAVPASLRAFMPQAAPEYEQHIEYLDPIGKLAMALVLFVLGSHFPLTRFRKVLRRVLRLSAGELGLTFVFVCGGMLLLPLEEVSWDAAILLGALALATAPATTILVLRENEAEGPVTEYATALVAINNLVAVVVFEVLYRAVHYYHYGSEAGVSRELMEFAADLCGSVALGMVAGLIVSFGCGILALRRWLVMLVGMSTLVLGLCGQLDVPYLLAFLAMGATVANSSDHADQMVSELDHFTGMLCVVFFVIHGAEMDIGALFTAGAVGLSYILLRSTGKYFGIFFAADAHHDGQDVKHWLGATLLAQAGAAIALSTIAADGLGAMGERLRTVILGTVIVFEIGGPIFIRVSVLRSGEVPLHQAIRHTSTTAMGELRTLLNRLIISVGLDPFAGRDPSQLVVDDVMRKNVKPVPASASFDEVISFLEESHDNTLPVVDISKELKGVLRYENLRHTLFDPDLGMLVRAEDLAVPTFQMLHPDESVDHAWRQFRHSTADSIMVVTRDAPHCFLGVVRRRELLRMFVRTDSTSGE